MARVTVTLPAELENPSRLVDDLLQAARVGLDASVPQAATTIASSKKLPRDRGLLQRSITPQRARIEGGEVKAAVIVSGPASAYADVQEGGRHPGRRRPPVKAIEGWVRRTRKQEVDKIARDLQSQYRANHPKRKRGKTPTLADFRERAVYLLTRGMIRKLTVSGMKGKGFVEAEFRAIEADTLATVTREVDDMLRRRGLDS